MEYQQHRRTATIQVPQYLATYALRKFTTNSQTGGIVIPDTFNLYHCVWQVMAKWPVERWHVGVTRRVDAPEGNLVIHLPNRRTEGDIRKDPRYWNYISPRSARAICRELKRLFDWEFHHYVENLLEYSPFITKKDAIRRFARKYALGIDVEDALLKNFQRHERQNRLFLGLNKVKSTRTSTPTLSCRKTPFREAANEVWSWFPDGGNDGTYLRRREHPLARAITEGLKLLGEAGEVFDPAL